MSCFDDLMQFRDEVDRAEKSIQRRGRIDGLKDLSPRDKSAEERLP